MREFAPYLRLYRQHWGMLSLGLLLTLCTLAAGIGLLSLSGWFLSAAAVAGLTVAGRDSFNYMTPAGAVRFFSIIRTASRWGDRVVSHDATFRVLTRLRVLFWDKLVPLRAERLAAFRQADLLNRLVADIDALDHVYLRLLIPLGAALLATLGLFAFLASLDLALALWLTGLLLLLGLLLPWLFYRLGREPGREQTLAKARLRTACVDYLEHQSELLLFGAEAEYRARLEAQEAELLSAQRRLAGLDGLGSALMLGCLSLLLALMLWLSADGVGEAGPGPLTALVVFLTLAAFELIQPLLGAFQHLSGSLTSARRLNQITEVSTPALFGQQTTPAISGALSLEGLRFGYPGCEPVLSGLDLRLEPGEKLAILGPTGCGKSTLLGLLTREWTAEQGEILLDGRPLEAYGETALRASMSVVSQRVHVFSASLADNLRLARPEASDEQLAAVLQAVELDALLGADPSPKGRKLALGQWLGEGGRQLSGGEQRRLSLARALLHDAPLLLLDEATEGLDPATEQAMLRLIFRHCQGKTLLMISHRLTGLEQVDRIALMGQGRILTAASHAELLAASEHYQDLHDLNSR